MRLLLSVSFALSLLTACGSDSSSGKTGGADGGASPVTSGLAQVRFRYEADWKDHLGACPTIADYRIKFGATPVPITVSIDVTPGSLGAHAGLEGRTYKDGDVLHVFSCRQSQTSAATKELYGKFGTDLTFVASRHYTVTLAGTVAAVAEDP
jgi:hypothetical protein